LSACCSAYIVRTLCVIVCPHSGMRHPPPTLAGKADPIRQFGRLLNSCRMCGRGYDGGGVSTRYCQWAATATSPGRGRYGHLPAPTTSFPAAASILSPTGGGSFLLSEKPIYRQQSVVTNPCSRCIAATLGHKQQSPPPPNAGLHPANLKCPGRICSRQQPEHAACSAAPASAAFAAT
jgi:hypothetical protein